MSPSEPRKDELVPADDAIARHREELKKRFPLPSPTRKKPPRSLVTPSIVIALLGFLVGLVWLDPAYRTEQFSSAVGTPQSIQLADGSLVNLDAGSQLKVSWHLRSRRAELQAGQAVFHISPALYRPFLTAAGAAQIRVVGTRYNVNRQHRDVRVTVQEGRVEVRGNQAQVSLAAGDQVLVRNGQLGKPVRVDAANSAAWTTGRLVFDRAPLREVLDVIQRYRPTAIVMHDRSLSELPVSGTFDSARLDSMLALLPKILPVDLSTDSNGTLHLNRRAAKK